MTYIPLLLQFQSLAQVRPILCLLFIQISFLSLLRIYCWGSNALSVDSADAYSDSVITPFSTMLAADLASYSVSDLYDSDYSSLTSTSRLLWVGSLKLD